MSAPVDISAEAVEQLAAGCDYYAAGEAAATLRALRAALTAAERERADGREAILVKLEELARRAEALGGHGKRDAVTLRHAAAVFRARPEGRGA